LNHRQHRDRGLLAHLRGEPVSLSLKIKMGPYFEKVIDRGIFNDLFEDPV